MLSATERRYRTSKSSAVSRVSRLGLAVIDEVADRCRMRHGPAKVDFDLDDVTTTQRDNLCVAEAMSIGAAPFVRDELAIAFCDEVDEFEPRRSFTIWPAAFEVGRAIESIVERGW
jgi:hypothetical protein